MPLAAAPDTEKPKGKLLARVAADLCKQRDFRFWLDKNRQVEQGLHTEEDARDFILFACKIESRAYLDHDDYAKKMFYKILTQFDEEVLKNPPKNLQKDGTLLLPKVLAAAKGAPCMRCRRPDATTVACHYQGPRCHTYGKGTGTKPWDIAVAFLCMTCHGLFDGYKNHPDEWMRSEEFQHYIILTICYLIRTGVLVES